MATEPTIRELHANLVDRQRASGCDSTVSRKRADEALRKAGERADKGPLPPREPRRG